MYFYYSNWNHIVLKQNVFDKTSKNPGKGVNLPTLKLYLQYNIINVFSLENKNETL